MPGSLSANRLAMAAMMAGSLLCGLRAPGLCQAYGGVVPASGHQNDQAYSDTGRDSSSQNGLTPAQEASLAVYETSISNGDPAAAGDFLIDKPLISALAEADPQKEASLKARAEALKDLQELLAMPWDDSNMNSLNQALTIRIDAGKPLCKVGVGPEPEKLLSWLAKYQPQYPEGKIEILKDAIRQWEVVFGTMTDTRNIQWGQARGKDSVNATKTEWRTWTIRERNAVMAQIIKKNPMFLDYDDTALAAMKDKMSLTEAVGKTINSGALSPAQLAQLSGRPLKDQIYLLGSFFDGSNVEVNPELKAKINAARDSLPKEVLPSRSRAIMGTMLNTAVSKELAGTQAGAKVLDFYSKDAKLNIIVRPCDGAYSRYDAASGAILLDSETIQQYMRMKGYTADSLMKSREQMREVAKYVSPLVVYEAGHQMQDAWAKKRGVYNPHVQESEIEAMSLEGLYTTEKMRKDPAFKEIFDSSRDFSSYASKSVAMATKYEKSGSKTFATTVRQLYFSNLPSLTAAASQVLGSVTEELTRRAALPAAEKAFIDSTGLNLAETMEMTPEELTGSVGEIRSATLAKIQADLYRLDAYKSRYSASDREDRKALKSLETGAAPKTGAPPAL